MLEAKEAASYNDIVLPSLTPDRIDMEDDISICSTTLRSKIEPVLTLPATLKLDPTFTNDLIETDEPANAESKTDNADENLLTILTDSEDDKCRQSNTLMLELNDCDPYTLTPLPNLPTPRIDIELAMWKKSRTETPEPHRTKDLIDPVDPKLVLFNVDSCAFESPIVM
jgi:hypothetical protein